MITIIGCTVRARGHILLTEQWPLLEDSGRSVILHSLSFIQNQHPEGVTTDQKYLT